jgi:hypothetical protein
MQKDTVENITLVFTEMEHWTHLLILLKNQELILMVAKGLTIKESGLCLVNTRLILKSLNPEVLMAAIFAGNLVKETYK